MEKPEMEDFKSVLVRAVGLAKGVGLSDDTVTAVASRLGDVLSRFVDPSDREQRLLKELWDVADESEQKTLARLVTKMVVEEPDTTPKH